MTKIVELKTNQLLLRQWQKEDFPLFAKINYDSVVMEYYPSVLSEDESNAMAHKFESLISERSWGFWAVELIDENKFIGFVGLHKPTYELPVTPCIEIGWRLAKEYWGKGYATEAARVALKFAFEELGLNEVYSFTSVSNKKSWSVMVRLGMQNTGANFEHPIIPESHPLREHVLYKITKAQWKNTVP
ncbi:GCN5 family acetyltransferase [Candidatus Thiomargarita nelsonii]|uniref:GCN5 family acetyltransferase n=1 Tax=Candidatus Thiomargarita nelsonii TaxID=1003181 RepID=A0A0A6PCP9_9GAMM|nr:GCN5 family acetyltransferase [Candidatus Thiomargarita nelsonii]